MKRLLVWAIPIFILLSGLYLDLGFAPGVWRLNFPGQAQQQPACNSYLDGKYSQACVCTDKGVWLTGFPFKSNLYDYCGQDEARIKWIDATDIAIIVVVTGGSFYLLRRVSRKNT